MKKKMLAAVLAGTMVMSLGTNLCWADGEKTKVTMTVWNGEWGDQLDRTMESFNSKHDDIELDITMQSGDYSDFLGTAAATNDWPEKRYRRRQYALHEKQRPAASRLCKRSRSWSV